MHNDSIETLLARHYGDTAVAPTGLEQRLHASVRQQAAELAQDQRLVTRLHTRAVSRRRAVQLVAIGSIGLGIVNLGLEVLEATLTGQEAAQSVATP
ncbi:MAG: hypothetical protein NVS4B12_13900 [Ktedonobacteraceae bacterium]